MIRHRYYVGTMTKDGLPVSDEQRTKLQETLCEVYGGWTMYAATGAWRDGAMVTLEPSEVYEGLSPSRPVDPQALAQRLATITEQSTVLWTEETVTGGFSA